MRNVEFHDLVDSPGSQQSPRRKDGNAVAEVLSVGEDVG